MTQVIKKHQKKLFTIDDMKKAIYTAHSDGRLYTREERKRYNVAYYTEGLLENLLLEKGIDIRTKDQEIWTEQ